MQCSFCPTSAFLLTRPKFYFGAAFFLFAGNHRVRHSVLRVGCRKSAENYLLTLHEGGFSPLKEQQHFSVPSAPFLSLVITELPGFATAPAKVAPAAHSRPYSCNSLLKEGSASSFQYKSFPPSECDIVCISLLVPQQFQFQEMSWALLNQSTHLEPGSEL